MCRGGEGWVEAGKRLEVALLDIGFVCLGVAVTVEKVDGRWRCRVKVEEMLIW